jgi:N-acetyl-anhydromuramyl-L-alanine amidase AmpD
MVSHRYHNLAPKGIGMRKITEIIIHCSATPEGRNHSVPDIDRWHRERGFSGIGYHYLIDLKGDIQTGRPVDQVGAHVAGHNTGTIGIVYVGGLDKNTLKAKDTRTPAQKAALVKLIKELLGRFPIKKISGHSDYAAKACPCFNARAEYAPLLKP